MRCYFCHGYSGDAKTVASSYLTPAPRDFTQLDPASLSREQMMAAVAQGRLGTAMMAFAATLREDEIGDVVDYVRKEFMLGERKNTRYHTPENGWPEHERYAAAFPFALGDLSLAIPIEKLTPTQQDGRRLFMSSCVTCHERAQHEAVPMRFDSRSVSYPRGDFAPASAEAEVDAVSGATPYASHAKGPNIDSKDPVLMDGAALFQQNCAFCHAPDGTGKNWIGSFLTARPRNLTDRAFAAKTDKARLREVILEGLPGTTMSAWKNVLSSAQVDAIVEYVWDAFVHKPAADAS